MNRAPKNMMVMKAAGTWLEDCLFLNHYRDTVYSSQQTNPDVERRTSSALIDGHMMRRSDYAMNKDHQLNSMKFEDIHHRWTDIMGSDTVGAHGPNGHPSSIRITQASWHADYSKYDIPEKIRSLPFTFLAKSIEVQWRLDGAFMERLNGCPTTINLENVRIASSYYGNLEITFNRNKSRYEFTIDPGHAAIITGMTLRKHIGMKSYQNVDPFSLTTFFLSPEQEMVFIIDHRHLCPTNALP